MKAFDILFISPSFEPILKEESIGTLILAKKAQLAGFKVGILRYWQSDGFMKKDYVAFKSEFVEKILESSPSIVSFYCRCTDYHISLDIAKEIKKVSSDTKIVYGGPQAELVSRDTLKFFPFVDYVACSEGENTIVPLLDYLIYQKLRPEDIPGLCYRNKVGEIIQNSFPSLLPNDYKRFFRYYDLIPETVVSRSNNLTIDVGRGCPYSCTFCSTKTFWKQKFRLRNIDDMIMEMKWIVLNYKITRFDFDHDMFTANKSKLRKFCDAIIENNLDVSWYCSSRLDTISPEDIDYMANAGMTSILFGVESGSKRMQKIINKNLDFSKGREIIKYAVSKGIKAKVSFMYGFPEETEDDFEDTLRLILEFQRLGAYIVIWRCGILNGTAMYDKFKDDLFLSDKNWKNYSFFGFRENRAMIKSHPTIFPHFYDHPNPLRKKTEFFDLFFYLWKDFSRVDFDRVADKFMLSAKRLVDMYDIFVSANMSIFSTHTPRSLDRFWNFSEDECRTLVDNFINSADISNI